MDLTNASDTVNAENTTTVELGQDNLTATALHPYPVIKVVKIPFIGHVPGKLPLIGRQDDGWEDSGI